MNPDLDFLIEIHPEDGFLGGEISCKKRRQTTRLLRLAPLTYNNAYKKFVEQRCDIFRLIPAVILHSW